MIIGLIKNKLKAVLIKILFTTPVLEYPPAGGPELRIANTIKALNMVSELHIISRVSFKNTGGYCAEKYFKNICYNYRYSPSAYINSCLLFKVLSYRLKINSKILNLIINIPLKIINRVYSILMKDIMIIYYNDINYIRKYIKRNKIDIVWFGYGNISYELMKNLKESLPEVKMVCDTDSVWSRFILRELDVENDYVRIKKIKENGLKKEKEEKSWVDFMDVTTAVSEVDAEYYRSIASDCEKIKIFSNVIDLKMYANKSFNNNKIIKPYIYLAGSFGNDNSPMNRAAEWVINKIFPIVKKSIPHLSLCILGKNSERINKYIKDDSIIVTGKVQTVLPYLCNADVSMVPLKYESGTRFKILEAGVCGIPIVSTSLGAEGIPVIHNESIIIADTTIEFANAIIKLVNDKYFSRKIALNCKNMVEEKYSVNALSKEGQIINDYLMKNDNK